jgi:AAA15 family ATPase/GTPase
MIHSFSCKNFYSFGDEVEISFDVNGNAPENNSYFSTPSGNRLSKVETVIGPNASGKTNLLKILPFLKRLIINSFDAKPDDPIVVQSFAFGEATNQPTELSVIFEIDGKVYDYAFILDKQKIISEELNLTSLAKEKKSSKKLFGRTWDEAKGRYNVDDSNFKLPKGFQDLLRKNASAISTAARLNHKESQEVAHYWQQMETNVIEHGWVGGHWGPNPQMRLMETFDFFSNHPNMKQWAEKVLSRFDLGLDGFSIEKKKIENGMSMSVSAVHAHHGHKYPLALQYESSGTMQLFVLLKSISQALQMGSIAVLDEFDVNLHPEMVMALFDLFIQPETNPKNAQLLMSTHSHMVLSKLDKYQIILVEKDENGMSEAWRLDDVDGVRADENYYAKYIAGAYGAVPKL